MYKYGVSDKMEGRYVGQGTVALKSAGDWVQSYGLKTSKGYKKGANFFSLQVLDTGGTNLNRSSLIKNASVWSKKRLKVR